MAIAKAAVAIVGVVGVATATSLALISSNPVPMPTWVSAEEDENTPYSTTYAKDYLKYLVGEGKNVTGQDGKKTNDAWWEWAFKNRYLPNKEKSKGKFEELKQENRKFTDLRAMCVDAYKASDSNGDSKIVKPTTGTTPTVGADKFLESNIWLFCSEGESKPKAISEASETGYETSSYGGTAADNVKLISTKVDTNDWFWKLKEKEMIDANTYPVTNATETSEFKKLHKDKATLSASTRKVRDKCQEAYVYATSSDKTNKYPEADVYKFCSLKGSK